MYFRTNREKWAYIAGVIEGDGCIGISKRKIESIIGYRYSPYLIIIAKSREYLCLLRDLIGCGWINNGNPSGCFQFGLGANDMRNILPKIQPFLILKTRQGELLKKVLELLKNNAGKKFRYNSIELKSNFEQLDNIYDEIKSIQGYKKSL